MTDICTLILYPAALLKSFNSSNSFLMESLGFSIYSTVSPALVAQMIKNLPAMWETWFDPWIWKIPWRRERLHTPVFWPEEFHGLYSPWGCKESDTTEQISLSFLSSFGLRIHQFYLQKNLILSFMIFLSLFFSLLFSLFPYFLFCLFLLKFLSIPSLC